MIKQTLQNLVQEKRDNNVPEFLIINFLKEYLQYPVLDFLYKNDPYRKFIFTGGSCLRICHGLPRLSEDLDFDLEEKDYNDLDWEKLESDIKKHFQDKYLLDVDTKLQTGKRVYIKFPVLHDLGLSFGGGSDFLFVKIEPSPKQFPAADTEIKAISEFGYNFIVKKYPLSQLMTGKISAIFTREWFQGEDNEVDIKGRDFYDLFWYFQNGIEPDYSILEKSLGIKGEQELKQKLKQRIEANVTPQKLSHDLKKFFPDQNFAEDLCQNYHTLIDNYLK